MELLVSTLFLMQPQEPYIGNYSQINSNKWSW